MSTTNSIKTKGKDKATNVASPGPYTLMDNSMAPQTAYDFYVRNNCGVGGVSPWTAVNTFTTACAPVTAPYNEDFETGYTPGSEDELYEVVKENFK